MIWKTLLALLGATVFVIVLALLLSPEQEKGNSNSVKRSSEKEKVWDGKGEHVYNLEIPDLDSLGSLRIERVSFSGLRQIKSVAVVRMSYEGSNLPSWLRGRKAEKSFTAFYQNSDDQINYDLSVGPPEDSISVIDFTIRDVPSVRLDPSSGKGLFIMIEGPLRREEPFYLRISANPEPGYTLGNR